MAGGISAVIVAAGTSSRMGRDKLTLDIAGVPALERTVRTFCACAFFDRIALVLAPGRMDAFSRFIVIDPRIILVPGGETRLLSARLGLLALPADTDIAVTHDGARALVTQEIIASCVESAKARGSGVAACAVTDTTWRAAADGSAAERLDRRVLMAEQTPSAFPYRALLSALEKCAADGFDATSEAAAMDHARHTVFFVDTPKSNLKLTTHEDIAIANALMGGSRATRVGHGYDVHRLVESRPLILLGETIPHTHGLLGHSDADVAAHALMDALLGAASLGDIGRHFPDSSNEYKGMSSMLMLSRVMVMLREKGLAPVSADVTIVAQRPKLAPFMPAMHKALSAALSLKPDRVNVKATTTEGLGFEGEGLGISSTAVALLQ